MVKRIDSLTAAQKAQMGPWAQKWIGIGLRIGETDWRRFEDGARASYRFANLSDPKVVVHVQSPFILAISAPIAGWLLNNRTWGEKDAKKCRGITVTGVGDAVGGAVGDAARDAVDGAIRGEVRDAVRDVVSGAVRDAVYGSISDAVGDVVRREVSDAVYGAVDGAVDGAIRGEVRDAVRDEVRDEIGDAVRGAVDEEVRGAVRVSVDDAVGGAVRDAVDGAVGDVVGDAVRDAVRAAARDVVDEGVDGVVDGAVDGSVGDVVRGAVGGAVRAAVGVAVDGVVGAAVDGAVDGVVGDVVRGAVRDAVDGVVGDVVRGAVGDAVIVAVGVAVGGAVRGAVGGAVRDAVTIQQYIRERWHWIMGGQFWVGSGWGYFGSPSFVSFFQDVCGLELPGDVGGRARAYQMTAESACWWWPHREFVMVCARPRNIHRDARGLLHNEAGMAIDWPDGWGVYAIHGVRVPALVVERPEQITVVMIRNERNAEVRRVMIERFGRERFLRESDARMLHRDEWGTLWSIPLPDEPMNLVEVVNGTPGPDGHFKVYLLGVNPRHTKALDAIASTFIRSDGRSLTGKEYAKMLAAQT